MSGKFSWEKHLREFDKSTTILEVFILTKLTLTCTRATVWEHTNLYNTTR